MSDDPALDDLLHDTREHFAAAMRQAYEAGKKAGIEEVQKLILSTLAGALDVVGRGLSTNAETQALLTPIASARPADSLPFDAVVARPVRNAMLGMMIGPHGVNPKQVCDYANRQPGTHLDIGQVRSALKALERRGDLVRVSRGMYRPSDSLRAERRQRGGGLDLNDASPQQEESPEEPESEPRSIVTTRPAMSSALIGSVSSVALLSGGDKPPITETPNSGKLFGAPKTNGITSLVN